MKISLILLILAFCIWQMGMNKPPMHKSPAKLAIFIDFDGYCHSISIVAGQEFGPSGLYQWQIDSIMRTVKRFYKYWDIDYVTSDSQFYSYPKDRRIRCVITGDTVYKPYLWLYTAVPGISRYNSLYLKDSTPAIVSAPLLPSIRFVGEAAVHEIGHCLGLAHQSLYSQDGDPLEEYNPGDSLVAPVMGVPYGAKKSSWWIGTNSFGQYQDDTAEISKTIKRIK